jgi:hypothetical protein
MKRMTTKMSTVTPMSTLTNSKSVGQGVKNISRGKGTKAMSMAMKTGKKASKDGAMESYANMPRLAMRSERTSMKSFEEMPQLMRKAVKTGTKSPSKAKAKMLPEVTVTAPKTKGRIALKVTSRKK